VARPIDPRQRRLHRTLYAGIAILILAGIAWMIAIQAQSLDGTITPGELAKNLGQDPYNIVVIDTRSPDAFRESHIPFAMNFPVEQLGRRLGELSAVQDRQVAVVDEDASRAKKGITILGQAGFRSVVILDGGLPAWRAAHKPLTP